MENLIGRQKGGRAAAEVVKKKHLEAYLESPNICLYCGQKILPENGKSAKEAKRKKFCNQSCSAKYSNKKRGYKPKYCKNCGVKIPIELKGKRYCSEDCRNTKKKRDYFYKNKTKGELFSDRKNWQSARSIIQRESRKNFENSGKKQECHICGYNKHIQVAHIKSVSEFPDDALIEEINHIDNLIALCPNCHWELDNGLVEL